MFGTQPELGVFVSFKGYLNEPGHAVFERVAWEKDDILEISYQFTVVMWVSVSVLN